MEGGGGGAPRGWKCDGSGLTAGAERRQEAATEGATATPLRVELMRPLPVGEGALRPAVKITHAWDQLGVTRRELLISPSELLASPSELSASPSELLISPSELLASPSRTLSVKATHLGSSPSNSSAYS
jgi:hypothetical protein